MIFYSLVAALVVLVSGIYALVQNPRRLTNRVIALVSFTAFAAQALQVIARIVGARYWSDPTSNPMPWVRWRFSVIAILCPFLVWCCYYVISGQFSSRRDLLKKLLPWAVVSAILAPIPFLEAFKSSESRPDLILNGPLFTPFLGVMLASLVWVCIASIRTARKMDGLQRLEFAFVTIPLGYLSLAAIVGTLINQVYPQSHFVEVIVKTLSFLVFIAFGISALSITSRRIYDSTQVLVPILQRTLLFALAGATTVIAVRSLSLLDSTLWSAAGLSGLLIWGFIVLDQRLRGILRLTSPQRVEAAAEKIRLAASVSSDPAQLTADLEGILSKFTGGCRVNVLQLEGNQFRHDETVLPRSLLHSSLLHNEGWVSVASLDRSSGFPRTDATLSAMHRAGFQLLVAPPLRKNDATILVGIGERENRAPFTHPEIKLLVELTEVANNLHIRSRLSLQARQAVQLGTIGLVGANIAHELRGPMATLNTFAQLLPHRLNDRDFLRDFAQLIPPEAQRIEGLANQLLDLSKPRQYQFVRLDLNRVVGDVAVLMRQSADVARVRLVQTCNAQRSWVRADAGALKQVLLNLVANSIEAISSQGTTGMVALSTFDRDGGVEIEVSDNGPGIPADVADRMFKPFVSSGKTAGVGLGLAISAEMVRIHGGNISAQNNTSGGACFRFLIPHSLNSSIST